MHKLAIVYGTNGIDRICCSMVGFQPEDVEKAVAVAKKSARWEEEAGVNRDLFCQSMADQGFKIITEDEIFEVEDEWDSASGLSYHDFAIIEPRLDDLSARVREFASSADKENFDACREFWGGVMKELVWLVGPMRGMETEYKEIVAKGGGIEDILTKAEEKASHGMNSWSAKDIVYDHLFTLMADTKLREITF